MAHKEAIAKKWNEALEAAKNCLSQNTFIEHGIKDNVAISYVPHDIGTIVKGECFICDWDVAGLIPAIVECNLEKRKVFDPKVKALAALCDFEHEGGQYFVRHIVMDSQSVLVSDRDFLYVQRRVEVYPGSWEIVTTSIDASDYDGTVPTSKGAVRATNIFTYLSVTEQDGGLKVIFLGQANLNGMIPLRLANAVVYDRPLMVSLIAKAFGKSLKKIE